MRRVRREGHLALSCSAPTAAPLHHVPQLNLWGLKLKRAALRAAPRCRPGCTLMTCLCVPVPVRSAHAELQT